MPKKKKPQTTDEYVECCIKTLRTEFYQKQPFETKKRFKHENKNYSYMNYVFYRIEEINKIELEKSLASKLFNSLGNGIIK